MIEKANGPIMRVFPIVIVSEKTPGKVRACVDMRLVNKAIKRARQATSTLDEFKVMLSGPKIFSKLDLN